MRRRKGFSMIEMITCTAILALIVLVVARSSMAVDALRVQTRDSVYLSLHNLNTMERLRQQCLEDGATMLLYYDDVALGSSTIQTEAFLKEASIDHFRVYKVRIESMMRDTRQRLTSEYIITTIGEYAEVTAS